MGAAVQFRMLATSGQDTGSTVGGLAAFSLLGVGGLLALPLFALPVILIGAPTTSRGLINAAILGAVGFVLFAGFGAVVLATDAPLRWSGRVAQRVRNSVLRKRPPLTNLDETLLHQRNLIRSCPGQAVVAGGAPLGRTPRPRLPLPPRRAAGDRQPPTTLLDPGGLRGRRHRRHDSHHAGRSGHCGGESDRTPCAGRRHLQVTRCSQR